MIGRVFGSAIACTSLLSLSLVEARPLLPLSWVQPPLSLQQRPGTAALATPIPPTQGVIRGRVIDDGSGEAVSGASVSLLFAGGERIATADGEGRFEASGLAPGSYRVYATSAGYVEGRHGQRIPGEDGTSVDVNGGQATSGIVVRLRRAGVIAGRIFDASGEGLSGIEIELHARLYLAGGATWRPVAFARTGEFGAFRLSDLEPADYRVKAHTGGQRRSATTEPPTVYAPTYFPQTMWPDEALSVTVSAGQELAGVDFALLAVETFDVNGVVVDPGHELGRTTVQYAPAETPGPGRTVAVASDGTFRIPDLIPGEYVLRTIPPELSIPPMAIPGVPVRVDDHQSGVELITRRGARLEGRIIGDRGRPLSFDLSTLRLGLEMRPGDGSIFLTDLVAAVRSDGAFSLGGAVWPATLRVSELPAGWFVKTVRFSGRDITHDATAFGEGVRRGLEVVLTDEPARLTDVSGSVTDRRGNAVSNYMVVVFPADRDRWRQPSPFVHGLRPNQDGRYRVQSLPPADYLAVAVTSLPQNAWADIQVIDQLWSQATPFQLEEGQQVTVNLQLSRTPAGLPAVR